MSEILTDFEMANTFVSESADHSPLDLAPFEHRVQEETARVNRYGGILGVIFFSLDRRSGERDETWNELVMKMAKNMRAYDVFGRWNNNEHAVLVPQRALSQVTGFAVRLRRFVDEYHLNGFRPFSASLGVTEYRRGEAVQLFLQRAQCAMDAAKAAGGNRISAARTDR